MHADREQEKGRRRGRGMDGGCGGEGSIYGGLFADSRIPTGKWDVQRASAEQVRGRDNSSSNNFTISTFITPSLASLMLGVCTTRTSACTRVSPRQTQRTTLDASSAAGRGVRLRCRFEKITEISFPQSGAHLPSQNEDYIQQYTAAVYIQRKSVEYCCTPKIHLQQLEG